MAAYQGQFRSIHKNKLYTVSIITNGQAVNPIEITLGPSPFVTTMDNDNATIYTPVKYSGATIQIVGNNYLFDLYSSTAKQNQVHIIDSSYNLCWTGYTTPNTYSAPYDFITETYTVEAIDGLSVLKYYDYKTVVPDERNFRTFSELISSILQTAGCYSFWYITTATYIDGRAGELTDALTISESNFFDEDENPMKMSEVLEEICKFLGVTAMAHGNSVYFVDYDALKRGYYGFKRYNVGASSPMSTTSLDTIKNVDAKAFMKTGSTLTLEMTYSKVTVKDSLYPVTSILPSMFENEDLQNTYYENEQNQNWYRGSGNRRLYTGSQKNGSQKAGGKWITWRAMQYLNKRYFHYYYDNNTGDRITNWHPYSILNIEDAVGAVFSKYQITTGDSMWEADAKQTGDGYSNYLTLPVNFRSGTHEVLRTKPNYERPFFMGGDSKLVVHGSVILADHATYPTSRADTPGGGSGGGGHLGYYPDTSNIKGDFDGLTFIWDFGKQLKLPRTALKLPLSISLGDDAYWYGDVPFYPDSVDNSQKLIENKNNHEIFYNEFGIRNTVDATDNIGGTGFVIPLGNIDSSVAMAVQPSVSLYSMGNVGANITGDKAIASGECPLGCAFLKDFDIVGVMPHQGGKDDNETDTEYSYVIDSDYVSELPTIEFKICTWDKKQLNYSAVAYEYTTGKYYFLDKLHSAALNISQRAEHLLCYRIVNQYSTPAKSLILNVTMDNVRPYTRVREFYLNTWFIIDSMAFDYINDSVEIKIVEKK